MKDCHLRTTCRLCDADVASALELTPTPPANELVTREFIESGSEQDVFPLELMTCGQCGHVQLSAVVSPERLFRNYPYRSGASPVFRKHLQDYADSLVERFGVPKFVVEIGSNDGTFLKMMADHGSMTLGVDPAGIKEETGRVGYAMTDAPFTRALAGDIVKGVDAVFGGHADLVVANHVFAHIDNLEDVALGVRDLLTDDGVFVFEVGYFVDVLRGCLFDTVYHEHLSYHTLMPLVSFFDRLNMHVLDAERTDTQGGSLRVFVRKGPREFPPHNVVKLTFAEYELGLSPQKVRDVVVEMGARIERKRVHVDRYLHELKAAGASIAGYGAPAKCVTLMHHFDFGSDVLDYIVDDSPVKHGLFTPGKFVEILPVKTLYERKPDYVLVLAWNFAESIRAAHPTFTFVVPLPKLQTFSDMRSGS